MRIGILLATCAAVLLSGCGGDDTSAPVDNPKAGAEAPQRSAEKNLPGARETLNGAIDAMRAKGSYRVRGENGEARFDVSVVKQDLAGSMTDSQDSFDFVLAGGVTYMRAAEGTWQAATDAPAALLADRWVELIPGGPLSSALKEMGMEEVADAFTDVPNTRVKTSRVDGEPVYLVTDNDGDLVAVSQRTGLPRAVTQDDGSMRVSYDDVQPVSVPRDARTLAEIVQEQPDGA